MKRTTRIPSVAALALWLLSDGAAAQDTTPSPPPPPTTTAPPPTTPPPSPWTQLAIGCTEAAATKAAATSSYKDCSAATTFTFEQNNIKTISEDTFCTSKSCLYLYRELKSISTGALYCANVPGLDDVRLDTRNGPTNCFGAAAASGRSDTIVRPTKSGSGSEGDKTTAPPTTEPPTTEPPTVTPEPSASGAEPSTTPKPSKTKTLKPGTQGSSSGSALGSVTPAPIDNADGSSGGMDTGTIVAIVGVSVGVVAVIVALVYVTTRKQKRKKSKHHRSTYSGGETVSHEQLQSYYGDPTRPSGSHVGRPSGMGISTAGPGGRSSNAWHSGTAGFSTAFAGAGWDEELIAAVRIPYEKLTFDELMSRGGYGEVYRGTYRGELVAIKTLLPERRRDMQQIQSFLAEVKIMANMEHERIVRFIGVAWDSLEELSVVSEFLERGDLRTVLAGFEKHKTCVHGFDANKVKIALHVAHGLTYMHTLQPIVLHRDLKSRNILLDAELNAKITDFGVSRERSDRTMTAGVGSSLWMAPEVMMGERYDEKADIFSFGVVLSELDNHVLPYSHAIERATGRRMPDAVILQMVSQGRMRVAFTDEATSEMARIGVKCVALSPSDRPTSAELLHLIHQVWRRY